MGGWVVVLVPDGLLTPMMPPAVLGDAHGAPFTRRTDAERVAARYTHGAYVVSMKAQVGD